MRKRLVLYPTAIVLLISITAYVPDGGAQKDADRWEPIRFLLGEWEGEGTNSRVSHTYEFILQNKFIHSRTRSEARPEEGETAGEVHEDWGFFSYDPDRNTIVFRQFLSEGFVNTYVLNPIEPPGGTLVFTSESTEGAGDLKARLTIRLLGDDRYRMVLDLARPGKGYNRCQDILMKRAN